MIKSKLKRRLRKKLHIGEFQELGFEVFFTFNHDLTEAKFNKFFEEFIDVIEENKLLFGGSGDRKSSEGFITSAIKFASPSIKDKDKIKIWLEIQKEVANCEFGVFLDAWNDSKWND